MMHRTIDLIKLNYRPLPELSNIPLTGSPVIDRQHRLLLDLCHQALGLLRQPTSTRQECQSLLAALHQMAVSHSLFEERLLAANHCPTYNGHRAEHWSYHQALATLAEQPPHSEWEKAEAINFINDYVNNHLFETDLDCRKFLQSNSSTTLGM